MKSSKSEILKRFAKGFVVALIIFVLNYFTKALPQMADAGLIGSTYMSLAIGVLLALEKAFLAL